MLIGLIYFQCAQLDQPYAEVWINFQSRIYSELFAKDIHLYLQEALRVQARERAC
jgi:hypothetical protein